MRKSTRIWLVVAAVLIVAGILAFGGVMHVLKWDFTQLSTAEFETNLHETLPEFKNITIQTETANVEIVASKDANSSVHCYEHKNAIHSVTVEGDSLVVEVKDNRKWYEHIGINFKSPKITVYIPQGEYGALSVKSSTGKVVIPQDFRFASIEVLEHTGHVACRASATGCIKIRTSTGDVYAEKISAGDMDICVSTGKVRLTDVQCEKNIHIEVSTGKTIMTDIKCKSFISDGSTGSLEMKNVIAADRFSIERDTGGVTFDSCDAAEIFVETDTGSVKGTLCTEKVFVTETDTGSVDVPDTVTGGRCEISTDTGDIKISID